MKGTGAWLKTQQRRNFLFLLAGSWPSGHSAFCFRRALGQSLCVPNSRQVTRQLPVDRKEECFSWLSEEPGFLIQPRGWGSDRDRWVNLQTFALWGDLPPSNAYLYTIVTLSCILRTSCFQMHFGTEVCASCGQFTKLRSRVKIQNFGVSEPEGPNSPSSSNPLI